MKRLTAITALLALTALPAGVSRADPPGQAVVIKADFPANMNQVTVSARLAGGTLSGAGVVSSSPANKTHHYAYPFTVTGGKAGPNEVVVVGHFAMPGQPAGPDVRLVVNRKTGACSFSIGTNGGSGTEMGTAIVTIK